MLAKLPTKEDALDGCHCHDQMTVMPSSWWMCPTVFGDMEDVHRGSARYAAGQDRSRYFSSTARPFVLNAVDH